jgi:hypothetical protein
MKQCSSNNSGENNNGAKPLHCLDSKTKKPLSQTPVRTHHLLGDGTPEGSESDLTAFIASVLTPSEVNFTTLF